ncbi:unnamed protein product, partial [Phaeothamnion confervicola]
LVAAFVCSPVRLALGSSFLQPLAAGALVRFYAISFGRRASVPFSESFVCYGTLALIGGGFPCLFEQVASWKYVGGVEESGSRLIVYCCGAEDNRTFSHPTSI